MYKTEWRFTEVKEWLQSRDQQSQMEGLWSVRRWSVSRCFWSTTLSRSHAKHRETVMDISDKAHCLQTPQEKNQVNQYKKPVINYMCVQSTAGEKIQAAGKRGDDKRMRWLDGIRFNGHEFEWTLGVGDGQGNLVCCSPWGCKESNVTEWLNWTVTETDVLWECSD